MQSKADPEYVILHIRQSNKNQYLKDTYIEMKISISRKKILMKLWECLEVI